MVLHKPIRRRFSPMKIKPFIAAENSPLSASVELDSIHETESGKQGNTLEEMYGWPSYSTFVLARASKFRTSAASGKRWRKASRAAGNNTSRLIRSITSERMARSMGG